MENLIEQIDKTTQNFIESFNELSSVQMNWKPNSGTWSIAQNIDHLIQINKTYFPIIESLRRGTYKSSYLSNIGFLVSFMGNTILKNVQPDRKKKMKTFRIWEPSKSELPQGIIDRFKSHQVELKNLIASSKDLVKEGVIISSPANKYIVYKLETSFEIIVAHEQRHFVQAKEILQLLRKGVS